LTCCFDCDKFISGYQRVEIEENQGGFMADTKRKPINMKKVILLVLMAVILIVLSINFSPVIQPDWIRR